MEWAISGSAVSLDEAAKFICQGIFEKNCGGDSAHCRFAAVDFFPVDERCACCHLRHYFDSCHFTFWGMVFLHYFQKKLSLFTDGLCQTLDHMMDSTDRPQVDYEAETLLSRISHRLERLYNVMQKTRHTAEGEKEELQSLVSDISHQTKTPIANLKLINDTMLTRPLTEEKRKEFLQATGTQLDKLDFLIQGMVKTSRLETGVITLEKQDAVIGDTLVSAINGVLAPMEQKEISLSVDCPSDLTISHDSRWTSEALFNILDNAVKYTSAGGSIQVRVRDWEMYLRIDVTDTGRGIPEHSQGTIFKRFYRDEAVHDIDGVGIGLYLAREIITMQAAILPLSLKLGRINFFRVPAHKIILRQSVLAGCLF